MQNKKKKKPRISRLESGYWARLMLYSTLINSAVTHCSHKYQHQNCYKTMAIRIAEQ